MSELVSNLVKLKFDTVRGSRVIGAYGFSFQFIKDVKQKVEGKTIFVEFHRMDITLNSSILGRAFPQGITVVSFYDFEQMDGRLNFIFNVDRARLESLEEVRNGQTLELDFWIHGLTRIDGESKAIQYHEKVVINQRQWTDALDETGYLKYFTFETAFPPDGDSEFKAVQEYFSKAQKLYLQGHYNETLVNCRCAMETLEKSMGIAAVITDARQHFCESKNSREDMTLEERIHLLYGATKSIAHLGAHPDGISEVTEKVMRKEAKLVLTMTGALLSHALGL